MWQDNTSRSCVQAGQRGLRPHGRPQGWRRLAALIGVCVATGCATPEDRYRTLSFFFDGVPLPASMRPPPPVEEASLVPSVLAIRAGLGTSKWVKHEPECKECHASKYTAFPDVDPPELCWECHYKENFVGKVAHGPFAAGACTQCHNPHKSQHGSLLVDSVPTLCLNCHDYESFPELEQHQVVEGDRCVDCHNPHTGPKAYMLKADVDADAFEPLTPRPRIEPRKTRSGP
jgi:predicted CXXCH cytochrome family protein